MPSSACLSTGFPSLTSMSGELDPRVVVLMEGDHEGRVFQNRLQFLPGFAL